MQTEKKNLLTVFLHALVWLIIVYCMKGSVTCYIIFFVELWVDVTHQILQQSTCQSCVKLYQCTQFGTNIVGNICTNSVT